MVWRIVNKEEDGHGAPVPEKLDANRVYHDAQAVRGEKQSWRRKTRLRRNVGPSIGLCIVVALPATRAKSRRCRCRSCVLLCCLHIYHTIVTDWPSLLSSLLDKRKYCFSSRLFPRTSIIRGKINLISDSLSRYLAFAIRASILRDILHQPLRLHWERHWYTDTSGLGRKDLETLSLRRSAKQQLPEWSLLLPLQYVCC